jgi:dihydropteroate synthase
VLLRLASRSLDLSRRPLVVGILNRTPDSFFDRGRYFGMEAALRRAEEMIEQGADVVEVGGVKAGPGPEVSVEEEIDRVVPAIRAIKERLGVIVAVDTFRSEVLSEALDAGAEIANDISGFSDPDYLKVAARHGAAVVATHIRLAPRLPDPEPVYEDVIESVAYFLSERLQRALKEGIARESVIADAGLDLGKTTSQSLALLTRRAFSRLSALGVPIMVAASRKRFLGETVGEPAERLLPATLAAACWSYLQGARVFRVHDVAEHRHALSVMEHLTSG